MKNIKICFLSGVISRSGGTERVGSIIANALSEKGYEVYLLSCWNQGKPYYPLNKYIHLHYLLDPKKEGKLYRTYLYPILKLHHFIKKNEIDILIDIDTELSIYSAYAIQGTKCKLISWEHFNYWTMERLAEPKRFRAKRLIKKYASKLVVLTEADRQKHIQEYQLPDDFVCAIPNPCLSNVSVNYQFDTHTFISVGRLTPQKGYDLLLKAWKIAQDKVDDWKLVIVGAGEEEKELVDLKEALALDRVEFAGHTADVEQYYKEAACYVMSSRYEGFPMVLLEAQSYALPVISFDCKTGPKELIDDEKNGYLVEDGNVDKLAETMMKFVKDKKKAEEISVYASERVKRYSIDSIIEQWTDVLENII